VGNVCLGGARWFALVAQGGLPQPLDFPALLLLPFSKNKFLKKFEDIVEIHFFYFFSTCIKYIDF
jgi:hypothetical protein